MNILVTVGTTRFDSLIKCVVEDPFFRQHQCTLQVGPGGLLYGDFEVFEYTNDIEKYYELADVVITHAGAGSIYRLLELRKSLVIVPNTDRRDTHQYDIAEFMLSNGYALSIYNLDCLSEAVINAARMTFRNFNRDLFSAGEDILTFICPERSPVDFKSGARKLIRRFKKHWPVR